MCALALYSNEIHGKTSAALLTTFNPEIELSTSAFGRPPSGKILPDTKLYIIGMFYNYDILKRLARYNDIYVFSNNEKVINTCDMLIEEGFSINGKRDKDKAPILSIWEFLYPDKKPPRIIEYISDYHTWQHNIKDTIPFHYGIQQYSIKDPYKSILWKLILNDDDKLLDYIIQSGNTILKYEDKLHMELCNDLSFYTNLDGVNALAINTRGSSLILQSHHGAGNVKLFINYEYVKDTYRVSLYCPEGCSTNVGKIASKFNGGGGPGAASFSCKELPFELSVKKLNDHFDDMDLEYGNKYKDSDLFRQRNYIVGKYVHDSNNKGSLFKHLFKKFLNIPAVIVNGYDNVETLFYPIILKDEQIGVSYIYTNRGYYRYVVHNLTPENVIEKLQKQMGGKIKNDKLIFYSKENFIEGE